MRRQQLQINGARQGQLKRADFAILDRGSERLGLERSLVALPEQRMHALAQLRQLRLRTLAPKQVATELVLQLLDGASERRLRHIALLCSLGEVQFADRGQEISDLMHFHSSSLSPHG